MFSKNLANIYDFLSLEAKYKFIFLQAVTEEIEFFTILAVKYGI
jgi:hypothetical protein